MATAYGKSGGIHFESNGYEFNQCTDCDRFIEDRVYI